MTRHKVTVITRHKVTVITRHKVTVIMINSREDLVSALFKLVYNLKKFRWRKNLKSALKNPRIEFTKERINLNYILSNRYNGADLVFFKKFKHAWMRLKLGLHHCWSRGRAIALCLVMTLVLISFCSFFFTQHVITRIWSIVQLHCTMFLALKKKRWRNNLRSNQKNLRTDFPKEGINLDYTLSNRYNAADLMFLFTEGLSLIIRRLSFSSNTNFLISLIYTLTFSKDGEWLQSSRWSLTALPLGLTFFLVNGEVPIYSPILTLRFLTHLP